MRSFSSEVREEPKVLEGLGDWELDVADVTTGRLLGDGASSTVFSGSWKGCPVAVKRLNRSVDRMTEHGRQALCRELAILQSVNHRHVVKMLGVIPYRPVQIITELCDGGSCYTLLHETPEVDLVWGQQMKMLEETAEAMSYLHNFDPPIIHRDLKSLNLLLDRLVVSSSCIPSVKLADFGLARLKDCNDSGSGCVFMTMDVGTSRWTAPEVSGPDTIYDEKVDVYSFAMLMYEIVCRYIPFVEIENRWDIARCVSLGERPSLECLPGDSPTILRSLFKLCWHQDPTARPEFQKVKKYLSMIADELRKNEGDGA